MEGEVLGLALSVTVIIAGVAVLLMAMLNRRKLLEMKHRERLAMIERGLVPSPEMDPLGFERRAFAMRPPSRSSVRFRSAGVLLIGIGLGLMLLISFAAASPRIGIGLGGGFALVGGALVLNAMFSARDELLPASGDIGGQQTRRETRESPPNVAP